MAKALILIILEGHPPRGRGSIASPIPRDFAKGEKQSL
ncbi:hypothetical protein HDF17_000426 [Granulicella arctica]|uniref:Uncharacterized protein n=1 Tax=Granulicella arctica TaxID=940613 RepID=A0A7Y9PE09_9BACT|nr:hypothetical protein [Granulicella arctica]